MGVCLDSREAVRAFFLILFFVDRSLLFLVIVSRMRPQEENVALLRTFFTFKPLASLAYDIHHTHTETPTGSNPAILVIYIVF